MLLRSCVDRSYFSNGSRKGVAAWVQSSLIASRRRPTDTDSLAYVMVRFPGSSSDIGPLALDRAAEEGLHPLVDLAAQPRHLALADAIQAHGAHQIVDRAGGDALDPREIGRAHV